MKRFLISNINGIVFWIFVATVFGFFSKYWFIFDICSHFRLQYLIFGVFVLFIYYIFKIQDKKLFVAILLIISLNFFEFTYCSLLNPPKISKSHIKQENSPSKQNIKIGLINLLTSNKHFQEVRDELTRINADILVVQEIDFVWSDELSEVKKIYPYNYEICRDDNFGIAIYSKIPVKNYSNLKVGIFDELPVLTILFEVNGKTIELIAVHTTPPAFSEYYKNTKKMLQDIGEYVNKSHNPCIVVGDINSSRFSYNYKNFIKISKLRDSGNILKLTWPSYWISLARIPLDHIFVDRGFEIKNFEVGNYVGSDHFPVSAELNI